MKRGGAVIRRWHGFQHCQRWCAGTGELQRNEVKQRPLAGEHRPALRHQIGGLQQDLRRARGHHPGQGPARDRDRPLDRAGRQQDAARRHRVAAVLRH